MRYVHTESELLETPFPLAKDLYLKMNAGDEISFSFGKEEIGFSAEDDNEYKLYFTGEADIPPEYRCEPQYPVLYRRICESLVRDGEKYRLKLASDDGRLPKCAFYKASGIDAGAKFIDFSCDIEGKIRKGTCRFEIEVYYHNGKPRFVYDEDAEIKERIEINGAGRYSKRIPLQGETDFVLLSLRADGFEGELLIDSPSLCDDGGKPLVRPFSMEPRDLTPKKWLGINFSKIERPSFTVLLNGHTIFQGESFERIYRWPSHTFSLPKELIAEKNVVTIRYDGGYLDPLAFTLRSADILKSPTEQGIVACGKYASAEFGVLIKLKERACVVCGSSRKEIEPVTEMATFPAGLHAVRFRSSPFEGSAHPTGLPADRDADHYFAVLAWHPYNFGGDSKIFVDGCNEMYAAAVRHGDEGKKVFITEFGYHDFDFVQSGRCKTKEEADKLQASFFATDFKAFREQLPYVETVHIFRLYDWVAGPGIEIDFGLFTSPAQTGDIRPKEKGKALYRLIRGEDADLSKIMIYARGEKK